MRLALLIGLASSLAACGTRPLGSVVGAECQLNHTPQYVVKGKTNYDQNWIDETVEGMVSGCGQPRPQRRPASLDAPVKRVVSPLADPNSPPVFVSAPKKERWYKRIWKKKPKA